MNRPSKPCAQCGRSFAWRKKWERDWDEIKYCGERCRRAGKRDNGALETAILELLRTRGNGKTICPSELLPPAGKQDPAAMERVREAARRLAHAGEIQITQGGRVVDPDDFRGPIRLRLLD